MLCIGEKKPRKCYFNGKEVERIYLGNTYLWPAMCAIAVSVDPAGSGTVTGAGQYREGEPVTLIAAAADGYKFTGWQEDGQTVSESGTYTFTATGDRELTAVFETKVSRLPAGYTEVEYIQTVSGQKHVINTKLNASTSLSATLDFYPLTAANTLQYIFYRVYSATSSGTNWSYCWNAYWRPAGLAAFMGRATNSAYAFSVSSDTTPRRMTMEMTSVGRTVAINGGVPVDCGGAATASYTGSAYVHIFGSPSSTVTTPFVEGRIYSCQMSNSNGLRRDFVPCTNSNGIAGLYDLVTNEFYQSLNNPSTVIAGPAV